MVAIRPTLVRQATVVATLETLAAALSTVAAHSFAGTGSLPARVPAVQFGVAHGPTAQTERRSHFDKVFGKTVGAQKSVSSAAAAATTVNLYAPAKCPPMFGKVGELVFGDVPPPFAVRIQL